MVYVSDLIEIVSGNSLTLEKLLAAPLGPAPRPGGKQDWLAQDILEHLALRGIRTETISWTGATAIQLTHESVPQVRQPEIPRSQDIHPRRIEQATRILQQSLADFLTLQSGEKNDWRMNFRLPLQYVSALQSRSNIVSISGGEAPFIGTQDFVIKLQTSSLAQSQAFEFSLPVEVSLPPMIVAAVNPIRRDEVLKARLLKYIPLPESLSKDESSYFTQMDELIGKRLRQSLSTNQPIPRQHIGEPLVIQRQEMIEVESVAGQVTVRTQGKAMENGAVGDLISVELIPAREKIYATVVGPLRVRVLAVSSRTATENSSIRY